MGWPQRLRCDDERPNLPIGKVSYSLFIPGVPGIILNHPMTKREQFRTCNVHPWLSPKRKINRLDLAQ